jgi:hypothetical protein
MPMALISFMNTNELMKFAEEYLVNDRLRSLEYDVNRCLQYDQHNYYSPLPALMYCFSMIDMLGALYGGNAKEKRDSTGMSGNYMKTLMKYPHDKVDLLQKAYRHKLVHLSAPKTAINYNGRTISWKLHDTTKIDHLEINSESGSIDLFSRGTIGYSGKFTVDIATLKDDIKQSVIRDIDGYLLRLQSDIDLQHKFTKAVNQIYEPLQYP